MSVHDLEHRLLWLLKISRTMLATRDIDHLLQTVLDGFIEATGAQIAHASLTDAGALQHRAGRNVRGTDLGPPPSRITRLISKVGRDGAPVFASAATGSANTLAGRGAEEAGLTAVVCLPLEGDTGITGVLYGETTEADHAGFTASQRQVVELLADHAAAAFENAALFERATNDPLTGLPNNNHFVHELARVMREATEGSPAGVLMLDLDSFKRVNAAGSTEAGDQALIDIANTLRDVLRADGLVARYSSDKFGILLPAESGTKIDLRLRDVAERARAAIRAKSYHGIQMSASIGGIAYPGPEITSAPDLVALADQCLGKARDQGGGAVEIG